VVKEPTSYEAISPESLNRKRHLVIDKYSGKSALNNRLLEIGFIVSEKELDNLLKKIKATPIMVNWGDEDIISLAKSLGIKV
jgi:isopropylmalate/homocitrate/citramalate synthase